MSEIVVLKRSRPEAEYTRRKFFRRQHKEKFSKSYENVTCDPQFHAVLSDAPSVLTPPFSTPRSLAAFLKTPDATPRLPLATPLATSLEPFAKVFDLLNTAFGCLAAFNKLSDTVPRTVYAKSNFDNILGRDSARLHSQRLLLNRDPARFHQQRLLAIALDLLVTAFGPLKPCSTLQFLWSDSSLSLTVTRVPSSTTSSSSSPSPCSMTLHHVRALAPKPSATPIFTFVDTPPHFRSSAVCNTTRSPTKPAPPPSTPLGMLQHLRQRRCRQACTQLGMDKRYRCAI